MFKMQCVHCFTKHVFVTPPGLPVCISCFQQLHCGVCGETGVGQTYPYNNALACSLCINIPRNTEIKSYRIRLQL